MRDLVMKASAPGVIRKWRPRLSVVVAGMLCFAVGLPLAGVFFFRIYENQLVRQVEGELIVQSAALAVMIEHRIANEIPSDVPLGAVVPEAVSGSDRFERPIVPMLDLAVNDLLPSRPDPREPTVPADPAFLLLGGNIMPDLLATQRLTLAGFRLLDPAGVVIAGRAEVGLSLAHVDEVAAALKGEFRSALRERKLNHAPPPLYSLSRGTALRVFVAVPIVVRGHVAAVLYASRTPTNVFKTLYEERAKVVLAALSVVLLAAMAGFAFHRALSAPVRQLIARTRAIAAGDRSAIKPLAYHGTAEFAELSQSFLDMATSLAHRSDFIESFAAHVSHELKSPLTSIRGAAELLRDDAAEPLMTTEQRMHFLGLIMADTGRLGVLVERLREFARAETVPMAGESMLAPVIADLQSEFPLAGLTASGALDKPVRMAAENMHIVLSHLIDNAIRNGAAKVSFAARDRDAELEILVRDDGAGISPNNRGKVFQPFFTTRRSDGGTGMGLSIVRAVIEAHGGTITLADGPETVFHILLPKAADE
jgi:signal transduction histidine kinase